MLVVINIKYKHIIRNIIRKKRKYKCTIQFTIHTVTNFCWSLNHTLTWRCNRWRPLLSSATFICACVLSSSGQVTNSTAFHCDCTAKTVVIIILNTSGNVQKTTGTHCNTNYASLISSIYWIVEFNLIVRSKRRWVY